MLTRLRVQNLKSVADSGPIDLRPLTFLMGPNSSGKSTLIQAILIARQTVDSRDMQNPLVVDGDYVKLGSYREFIHQHQRGRRLCLEFGFSAEGLPSWGAGRALETQIRSVLVSAEFSYNQKTLQMFSTAVSYMTDPHRYDMRKKRLTPRDTVIEFGPEESPLFRMRIPSAAKFYDLGPRALYPYARRRGIVPLVRRVTKETEREVDVGLDLLFLLTQAFEWQFNRTFYVGPLRTTPQRTYLAAGETPQDVGLQGESTFAILWASRWNRRLRESVLRPVNEWLSAFSIAAKLEIKRIGGTYFTLLVTDPQLNVQASFADVGFGASQLLPAIVEALYAPRGSTIIMEQPEIHLHPGAQATLGDFFVDQAQRGKQLLVETHSEHLVSRVLRRIAEGALPRSEVAVYYCQPTEAGTEVRGIPLDEFGRFGEGLPSGFFDQGYAESIAHVEAVAKRVGARRSDGA